MTRIVARAAPFRPVERRSDERSHGARRDADREVAGRERLRRSSAFLGAVFGAFPSPENGRAASGDDGPHAPRVRAEGRRQLRGLEHRQTSARARSEEETVFSGEKRLAEGLCRADDVVSRRPKGNEARADLPPASSRQCERRRGGRAARAAGWAASVERSLKRMPPRFAGTGRVLRVV